jgi:LacI family transcriptional regulator, repressor for deo operon, udp, cdd, tsx, nupC, and nupG
VPDITNPFNFDIIRGSQERLRASGFIQIVVDTEESAGTEAHYLDLLGPSSAGIILTASRLTDQQILAAAERFRIVTINRSVPGVPNVIVNSAAAFDQAVTHLASLGHRHICYIAGPASSWSNRQRWEACEQAAARIGVSAVRIGPYAPKTASGPAAADEFLSTGATAGIAFNDLIAIGMLQRFASRGFGVPEHISLIGCDDIFGADFCHPPLTTVTSPADQAGRTLIDLLLGTRPAAQVVLPAELRVRDSTGPAPR